MEFKGTKGEWFVGVANVKDSNKDELVISKKGGEKVDRGYRLVARISPMDDYDDIDISNAKLISAAPELLKALCDLVSPGAGGPLQCLEDAGFEDEVKEAQRVIEKALK